jgi:O-antigen ligase
VPQPASAATSTQRQSEAAGFAQPPLKLGIGLAFLVFYLWIIHSHKLTSADLAVLGLGVGVLARGGSIRIPMPLWWFGAFILWSWSGLMVTQDATVTLTTLTGLIKVWIISLLASNVVRSAAELRFVVIAWLGLFALYPVRGALYNQYICHCSTGGRVSWNYIFANPNDLAALSLIPLGLAAGVAVVERVRLWKLAASAGVLVLALIIMLTQSRGAMLAMGGAVLMLPLTSRRRARDLTLLVLLIGAAAVAAPKGVWERLAGLSNASVESGMQGVDPEGSAQSRWQIWQIALEQVRKNPIMGVGAGMMPITHRWEASRMNLGPYVRGERDTHSTYLKIAAESGLPALLLYLGMWVSMFMSVRRARSPIKYSRPHEYQFLVFVELAMVAFLIASIFGSYGALSFTYFGVVVIATVAAILEREPWYVPPRVRNATARA